jgi:hypothetical protein
VRMALETVPGYRFGSGNQCCAERAAPHGLWWLRQNASAARTCGNLYVWRVGGQAGFAPHRAWRCARGPNRACQGSARLSAVVQKRWRRAQGRLAPVAICAGSSEVIDCDDGQDQEQDQGQRSAWSA